MELNPEIIWFLVGLLLMIMELAAPNAVFVFFGVAAWITALAVYTGLTVTHVSQLAIFSASSAILIKGIRNKVLLLFFQDRSIDEQ